MVDNFKIFVSIIISDVKKHITELFYFFINLFHMSAVGFFQFPHALSLLIKCLSGLRWQVFHDFSQLKSFPFYLSHLVSVRKHFLTSS